MRPNSSDTVPSVDDVNSILDSYADLLALAVEHANAPAESATYLPTRRAIRCCCDALESLHIAINGIDYAQSFTRPVVIDGRWFRPVDLLRRSLAQLENAALVVRRHQSSAATPSTNLVALSGLAERLYHVEQDLRGLIGPTVEHLSFPHRQQAQMN